MKAPRVTSSLMNAIANLSSLVTAYCLLVGLSLLASCSHSPGSGVVGNSTRQLAHALSASEAAQLAARLASEERTPPRVNHYPTTFPGVTQKEVGQLEAPQALPRETFGRIVLTNVGCISFD
jgi:hypothetical protein